MVNEEVTMTMSVLPGAMTGISTLMAGMVSINNIFMDVTRQIDSTFGLVDSTIITTGAVIAQFGFQAAQAFGEFEQGMKIVQMVSGQTKSDIEQLSQVANQFSVQYRTDIDQITEGLQTLGRAGLNSAAEQTEVLQNGLNTAKLESRDLNNVLEELIQNTALLGGDLKSSSFGEDSQYINDLLVATSMSAPIDTHDVSETLKYSGGIAAAAGARIRDAEGNADEQGKAILEDYMGAIAAFAQKGVTGSIAGTALRAFFNKPATQDSSVKEALATLKLKPEYLWEDDEQTMKPVSEQINIIQKQMEKLDISTMDRLQIWSKIVGGKMGQQMMKLDSSDIKELTKDIQAADSATSLAAGSMQTFQGNMKEMAEQGQVAFREFGSRVAQTMNPVIDLVTEFLKVLSNPYVSAGLFAGFIAVIIKVARTIKKVLDGLKTEFSTFMAHFSTGETLMAMKPSVERGLKRKEGYTDYSKSYVSDEVTTVDGLVKAFKQQAAEDRLKYLRDKYELSDAEIGALGVTKSWTKSTLVDGMGDNKVLESFIKSHALNDEMLNDIFVLNKDEWIGKYIESLQPEINKFSTSLEDASRKVQNFGNTVETKEERKKRASNLIKNAIDDSQKQIEEEHKRNIEGNIGSRDKGPDIVSDENWYTRPVPGNLTNEARDYANKQNKNEEVPITSDILSGEIKLINETRLGTGILQDQTIGTTYFNEKQAKEWSEFAANGPKIIGDSFLDDVEDLQSKLFPESDYETVMSGLIDEYGKSNFEPSGLTAEQADRIPKLSKYYSDNVNSFLFKIREHQKSIQIPLGRIAEDFINFQLPNITKEEFGNFSLDEDHKIKDLIHGKDFDRLYNKFTEHIENNLKGYIGYIEDSLPAYEKKTYPTLQELQGDKQGRIMTKAQIASILDEKGIDYGGNYNKISKDKLINLAAPYILDWETMNWNDFRKFASSEGVSAKGSRADIIARLNEKYENELSPIAKNWLDDFDNVANELEEVHQENQRLIDDIERMRREVAELKQIREQKDAELKQKEELREQNKNWDANEEARKRREHIDELTRTEGKETAERLGVKKDPETLEETEARLHKELEEQEEEKILREKQLTNQNEINHFYSHSNDALRKQYNRQIGPNPYFDEDESVYYEEIVDPWGYGALAKEKADKTHTGDSFINTNPFNGDGYQEFYEDMEKEATEEMYRVLNEATGATYGEAQKKGFLSRIKDSNVFQGVKGKLGWSQTASLVSNLGTAASNVAGIFGGPLVVGMMAFQGVMTMVQEAFQEYCNELKEAKNQVREAYSKRSSAENALEEAYREQNPDATDEEISGLVLSAYETMQEDRKNQDKWMEKVAANTEATQKRYGYDEEKDDGSYKEIKEEKTEEEELQQSIDENTAALYAATAEIAIALDKMVSKMDDSIWGLSGKATLLSDKWGEFIDKTGGLGEGSSFSGTGTYLQTASQKDSNYPGYTEFAGLFLEDSFDSNGALAGTINTLFGADADNYMAAMSKGTKDFLRNLSSFSRGIGRAGNSRLQASMMNDKKSWQIGAKEIAKYESKNKKSVGEQPTKNKRLENLIKKLQIDTGLSRIQVLQGLYLQQMQDMFQVAEQVMVPLIAQNAQAAANTMMLGQAEFPYSQGTTNYTYGTMQIAQAISAQLAVIAWAKAGEATRNAAMADPNNPLHELAMSTDDGDQFMKQAIQNEMGYDIGGPIMGAISQIGAPLLFNKHINGESLGEHLFGVSSYSEMEEKYHINPEKAHFYIGGGDTQAMDQILDTFGATTYTGLGMSMNDAIKAAQEDRKQLRESGEDYGGIYSYFAGMWGSEQMAEKVFDSYMASGLGEEEGSGGGSGSGSGSGNDNDNTGTRKERVDLVLCSKKEIPKLNVNLFKKPPTFTVLNKNFKVRDVKINTEDTPKAIMSSIKNAFIDVQKRSDPKIIQDEEAVYDPNGATDGNPLPSGSAKTKTDQT